jgi:hypothetical protein
LTPECSFSLRRTSLTIHPYQPVLHKSFTDKVTSSHSDGFESTNISKVYISYWETPGVSERRRSVNLEASISGENQTIGGHSGRPSE